ncbi:MAG: DUF1064 domain-containing protein [Metallibacterium sp.]
MSISWAQFKKLFPKQAEAVKNDKKSQNILLEFHNKISSYETEADDPYNKYKAQKTEYNGRIYASKKEAEYAYKLGLLQKSGEVISIFPQPEFELQPAYVKNGKKIRSIKYIADFLVKYKDGHEGIIDCKGIKTREFTIKQKMFEYKYPELKIIII